MQLTTDDAVKVMRKMGVVPKSCKHHIRGLLVVGGQVVLAVHCSFGHKDLPGAVPHRFRKSLHLSVEEFDAFRSCTLSKEEYIAILRNKGIL